MSLLDRCGAFLSRISPSPGPADELDLRDFVLSEMGRAADKSLKETAPLVLYFATEADREEFAAAIHAAKPGMVARKWP